MSTLSCETVRESLSAALDGEPAADGSIGRSADLDRHLSGCPDCTRWMGMASAMHRSVRVTEARAIPDRTDAIMAAIAEEQRRLAGSTRPSMVPMARIALTIIGLVAMAAAIPELFHTTDAFSSAHGARELGTFEVTLAAGFLIAARRPIHAGLVAMLGLIVSAGLVITGALDLGFGHTALGIEVHHTLAILGTVLACIIARAHPARTDVAGTATSTPRTFGTRSYAR